MSARDRGRLPGRVRGLIAELRGPRDAGGGSDRAVAARLALLATSGVQLGFQASLSGVSYPEVFAGPREEFPTRQVERGRRLGPLGATIYSGVVAAAGMAAVTTARDRGASPIARSATGVACLAAVGVPVVTGFASASLHRDVAAGHTEPARIEAILVADRTRTVAAAVAVVSALRALRA